MTLRRLALLLTVCVLCPLSPSPVSASQVPLTIDGVINCAHPDNAITTTCRGENQPEPAPVSTEAPAAGTTTLHSGDKTFDCSTEPDASDPHCLPLTIDGVINCAHPDNAITTTCWNAFEESKAKGEIPAIDCANEKFSAYPVCTGIKPQAVVDFENASRFETSSVTIEQPEADSFSATVIAVKEDATTPNSNTEGSSAKDNIQTEAASGEIDVQSIKAKKTTVSITVVGTVQSIEIVATKKGSRTISREVVVDRGRPLKVQFSRSLKGYQVKLLVDGLEVDRKRV